MNGKNIESGRMAVAVLVGGRSIRMGLPKESVVIPDDGRTFLERICDEVDIISERLFVARYLSVRDGQCIERDGYINVPDRYAGIGPIGGIYSSLEKAAGPRLERTLERLAGAVMCDMDEEWQDARYFSERKMAELYDESRAARAEEPPTPERLREWSLVAKRAIESSLELADEMEAA